MGLLDSLLQEKKKPSPRMTTQNPQSLIKKLVPTWRFLKQTSPEKYGSGPIGLMKNAWGEVSEVVVCAGFAAFSIVGIYLNYLEEKRTNYATNKAYKEFYTVYRPDDPRIARVKEEWFANGAPPMTSSKHM